MADPAQATPRPYVVHGSDGGEPLDLGRGVLRVLLSAGDSGGGLAVVEAAQPPGGGPPLHTHSREDESFYVLAGSFSFVCGEDALAGGPGSFVWLPRGTPHRYEAGPEGGRLLALFTPGGMENYFRDWARLVARGEMSDTAMQELATRHGLQLRGRYSG
jgi:quercetin dioxygenase-like cupin family protein